MGTKRKEREHDNVELPSEVPENSSEQPHISGFVHMFA
jgi:hypothetical protein